MWEHELAAKLTDAQSPAARTTIIESYSRVTGLSAASLYRKAKENGWSSGRKSRADKGATTLNEYQIHFIHSLLHTTARDNKGAHMPVKVALEIAEKNGIIEPGLISESALRRILKERGMDKATMKTAIPAVQMQSLHPNDVHVADSSVCIQYYLKNGKMGIRDERTLYKNKIENFKSIKNRLMRYVLVDHFSGALFVKYYYSAGETQEDLFDFIVSAWETKSTSNYPFRGVPKQLLRDHGSANMSKSIMHLLAQLNVKTPKSTPYKSQIQGAVERMHSFVEDNFESCLRLQPASSLEDINAWVYDWCVAINARYIHKRHGSTRNAIWLRIKQEQLIELPERKLLQMLFVKPEDERTVNARYAIDFDTKEYDLRMIEGLIPRKSKVDVILRIFDYPKIGVRFNGQEYLVEPIGKNEAGFRVDSPVIGESYKALPQSQVQKNKEIAENLAYGEERGKEDIPFGGALEVMGNRSEGVADYMRRTGTAHELSKADVLEDKRISIIELFEKLARKTGQPVSKQLNQELKDKYGASISIKEADKVIWELTEGGTENAETSRTLSS